MVAFSGNPASTARRSQNPLTMTSPPSHSPSSDPTLLLGCQPTSLNRRNRARSTRGLPLGQKLPGGVCLYRFPCCPAPVPTVAGSLKVLASSGAICRRTWLREPGFCSRPLAGNAVADRVLRKCGGSLSFFSAVDFTDSNTRGCTDVRRGQQPSRWTSRERGRPNAWQSRTQDALWFGGLGWGWTAAFHCQVDAFSLPTTSAKIGTSTYLSRRVPTVPGSEAADILFGLVAKGNQDQGTASLVSSVDCLQLDEDTGPSVMARSLASRGRIQTRARDGQGGGAGGAWRTLVLAERVFLVCKTRRHIPPGAVCISTCPQGS